MKFFHYVSMCSRQDPPKKKHRLADIFSLYLKRYINSPDKKLYLDSKHWLAINKIRTCRTSRIGVTVFQCDGCGKSHYMFRSCKHRFCGSCGVDSTYAWSRQTLSRLLNMKHHHVVTTLPSALRHLSQLNGDLLHSLLFQSSSDLLKSWFCAKHNLLPGIVSVLHTAGSDLKYHPHVHMILSGGGQDLDTGEYRELPGSYLCAQRFLGKQLRIKFELGLLSLYKKGLLVVPDRIKDLQDLESFVSSIGKKHWIVSVQKPLSDLSEIVGYVGRYTKRCCLSEYKIESISDGAIKFWSNDYKNSKRGEKAKQVLVSLDYVTFLDRLLQHVPSKRYRMVRYYGLYSSYHLSKIPLEHRGEELEDSSYLGEEYEGEDWGAFGSYRKRQIKLGKEDPLFCLNCQQDLVALRLYYDYFNPISYYDDG